MTRTFVYAASFSAKWDAIGLTDDDLIALEKYLLENPDVGNIIVGTGGLRKVRWALPSSGKSGGIRVLYVDVIVSGELHIIDLFAKGQKENLTKAERNEIKLVVLKIKRGGK